MKYGLIGEHLKHSFSKEIHQSLGGYDYEIKEISKSDFDKFMTVRDFLAINVTIPYKEQVIPYLHFIDEHAKEIGAVNTIVNRGGLLYGYNTDFYGMNMLISHAGVDLVGKKVAILGTGGTSKTAKAVATSLSAKEIITVSRKIGDGIITYDELNSQHSDTEIIINTTPVGMYPDIYKKPIDIKKFPNLSGVIDAVYNPLQTTLVQDAREIGIPAEGGLYMLIAQGVRASEIFLGKEYERKTLDALYKKIKSNKENIVLIGMPSSGKSTVGKLVALNLGRSLIDTDLYIEKNEETSVPDIINTMGEKRFREIESNAVFEISKSTGVVIATGGGVPLNQENIKALSKNGKIYFIDRPLNSLIPTGDRPLTSTPEALERKFKERYDIYKSSADVRIDADCEVLEVLEKIMGDFKK